MKTTTTTIAALFATLLFGAAVAAEGDKVDFQTLDANGDGVITADEAQAHPELMEAWATLDENADGALDEEEFANFKSES
jgi:Ca2+-binding EF-hand superfamily protein